jgi:hypothetical protein
MIATTAPGARIGCSKQRLDFRPRQKVNEPAIVALSGHRQHALDLRRIRGRLEGRITEERTDRRQAQIPCAGIDGPGLFQIVQKCCHERRIDVLKCQVVRWFVQSLVGKPKKQPERIPIRTDGVRAGLSLLHETFRKEPLQ